MLAPGRDRARINELLDKLSNHVEGPRGLDRTYATALNSMAAPPAVAAQAMRALAEQLREAAGIADELTALCELEKTDG